MYQWTLFQVMKMLLERQIPRVAHVQIGINDVRDCAAAHVRAMTLPEAAGESVCQFTCKKVCPAGSNC